MEEEVNRYLKLEIPRGQSIFLWGARNSGKSTYLHRHFPDSVYYDLLQTDVYLRFLKEPFRLREEILQFSPEVRIRRMNRKFLENLICLLKSFTS